MFHTSIAVLLTGGIVMVVVSVRVMKVVLVIPSLAVVTEG
jgi:hypothetical protein